MTDDDARALVRSVLGRIAPDADLDGLGDDEGLAEALDLDSIDFLNLVGGLQEATGLPFPERDYPRLTTMRGCIDYLVGTAVPPPA